MRIFICCSKKFYDRIPEIEKKLNMLGHVCTMPNSLEDPEMEKRQKDLGAHEHATWKASMLRKSTSKIEANDAILVLNFKKGELENYIGGATFIEMYDAFRLGKKIFLYNDIPEGMLHDEILGLQPVVINSELDKIK